MSPSVSVVLQQERKRFDNLLSIVLTSLTSLHDAMKGNVLFNETLEEMAKCILQNKIPTQWLVSCPFGFQANYFINPTYFSKQISQLRLKMLLSSEIKKELEPGS